MAMRNREDDGMITKVVSINRVSKTVKGGRIMSLLLWLSLATARAPSATASASPVKFPRLSARVRPLPRRICTRLP